MFGFRKKNEEIVQGPTRTVFAKITQEEILELDILKTREQEAERLFKQVNDLDDFEQAAELYGKCVKESLQWWVKIEDKYGIPHELNLGVNNATCEVYLRPMPGDIIPVKLNGGR